MKTKEVNQQQNSISVNQKINKVYWEYYTYSTNQTRQFYENAILFKNQGTGDVLINDVYTLQPGDADSFNCDQNEINQNPYKITFAPGATTNKLAIAVKINEGTMQSIYNNQRNVSYPGDRRAQNKAYVKRRNRGDF